MTFQSVDPAVEATARAVVDSAYSVHRNLGPGLVEPVYQACMYHELDKRDISCATEEMVPIVYDGITLDNRLRLDLRVNNHLIVELKAVDRIREVHRAQALTYLKVTGLCLALLINFNVALIKDGIHRIIL